MTKAKDFLQNFLGIFVKNYANFFSVFLLIFHEIEIIAFKFRVWVYFKNAVSKLYPENPINDEHVQNVRHVRG